MSMPPLVRSLLRQRLLPLLLAVQVALAGAILANVLFLLYQQAAPMLIDDGIAGDELVIADHLISGKGSWSAAEVEAGRRALTALPGVRAASPTLGLPMRQTMTLTFTIKSPAGIVVTASGFGGEQLVRTLGLKLVAGRDFLASEYAPVFVDNPAAKSTGTMKPVIITAALARTLFPDGKVLGQPLRSPDPAESDGFIVVGIIEHLLRYQLDQLDDGKAEYSMLIAGKSDNSPILGYVLRIDPAQRQGLHERVQQTLQQHFGSAMLANMKPLVADYAQLRADGFKPRRAAVWLLGSVVALVTLITALGIASLSAYWVEQRTRQIGIRRALGASRAQIRQHFQLENLLVAGSGVLAGFPLALLANDLLMRQYELPRLPLHWLLAGALLLLLLGQFAVLGPARRAASVPPALATRSA
jgi:putative ABC transport system permease protein